MEQRVRRLISKFRRDGEELEGQIDVTHIPFDEIRRVVKANPDDPLMYYTYELNPDQLAFFQSYISERLDITQHEYFIEVSAES